MTRWKASTIHLALSVVVLTAIAALLGWRWDPPGLFQMAQADKLLLIIAGVDVVMGPLLTLIVYRQGKKSLKFDLAVIALLQLAAMAYGLGTVWQSRPVYLVAMEDRFRMVFANELEPEDLAKGAPQYRSLPWLTVEPIAALVPTDKAKRQDLLFLTLDTGKDIHLLPEFYGPFAAIAPKLLAQAPSARDFAAQLQGEEADRFDAAVRATGRPPEALRVVPVSSHRGEATMLVDARDATPLKPVAIEAWPVLSKLEKRAASATGG